MFEIDPYWTLSEGTLLATVRPDRLVESLAALGEMGIAAAAVGEVIRGKLLQADWPRGQAYSTIADSKGRSAFRMMMPEYYASSCLSCHGSPKGQTDITGYPKEGGKEGDLGAIISVTLFK